MTRPLEGTGSGPSGLMIQEDKPPDGGWGWIVAFCSFVNHIFIFGILLSMGVVYVSWLEEFGNSKSSTSWIISVCASLCFLSGPIAGSVAARYGYRFTATFGGLLTAIGFILCYFATSVFYLIIVIGVIAGVSFGFSYLSSLAIVVIYFDKKRALATGIGTSGVGIGSFFFPQLMNALVENYGWRGCLLIVGGLLLNMCVTGALMRPLVFKSSKYGKDEVKNVSEGLEDRDAGSEAEEKQDGRIFEDMMTYDKEGPQKTIRVESEERLKEPFPTSTDGIVYREREGMDVSRNYHGVSSGDDDKTASYADQEGDDSGALITRTPEIKHSSTGSCYNLHSCETVANKIAGNPQLLCHSDENITSLVANFDDPNSHIFYELPILSRSTPALRTVPTNDYYIYSNSNHTRPSSSMQVVDKACSGLHSQVNHRKRNFRLSTWKRNTISTIRENVEVMKDCAFLLFSVSQVFLTFSYLTPVVYMVDRAIDNGITKSQGAWLISSNGVGSLIGRLLFGAIADRYKKGSLLFYIVLLSVTGVFTMLSPLCGGSILLHCGYASVFGLGIGAVSTLSVVLMVDLVGLSRLSSAFGIVLWFAGIGHLVGPPFAGFIYDVTQSYAVCYVSQGFVLTCSGLMLIPIFHIRSRLACHGASRDLT